MRGLAISAPASGAGKTTVTLGLLAALKAKGLDVVSAKSGPDYIDPAFHAAATGRDCATLDAWAAEPGQLVARVPRDAELLVVEGAMGLFDGADDGTPDGCGGTADLAAALGLPVLLVLDCARMGQGAAAIVEGLAWHRDRVKVAGVLLNRVGSPRHGEILARSISRICPVLGHLPRRDDLATPSRHLGLVQAGEHGDLAAFIGRARDWVAGHCDLDLIAGLAAGIGEGHAPRRFRPLGQRIAVARDIAFAFTYPHMLADWRAGGAELSFFSPLADEAPDPAADAVFLPGGYPELHAGRLAAADAFRAGMAAAAGRGAVIYGECGGYMVLGEGLTDADGARHAMLGLLALETSFAERQRHLGYRSFSAAEGPLAGHYRGHEFHYATTVRAEGAALFEASDAAGRPLDPMGLRRGSVMGSFAHLIEPR